MVADEVVVVLEARIADYQRKLAQADKSFERATGNMANQAKRATGIAGSAFGGFAKGLLASVSVGALIAIGGAFIQMADKAKLLDAQLKLATAGFGNFATAQAQVRDIATATRSPLQETAKLYATLMRSANELGISQNEAARATLSISQAFRISGSDAVSAAQGTRQLIQAIQSGVLRGDEFNTVMEGAPRLARLLADSLGMPVTALRDMAEQGKLTGDALINALTNRKFTDALDAEFKQLPVTFGDAMTLVSNAAQITFSAFDRGGSFSEMLANFATEGATNFTALEKRAEIAGANLAATFEALGNIFDPMGDNAVSVMSLIEGEIRGIQNLIADLLGAMDSVSNAVPRWANSIRERARNHGLGGLVAEDTPMNNRAGAFRRDVNQGRNARLLENIMRTPLPGMEGDADVRGNKVTRPPKTKAARKRTGKSAAELAEEAAKKEQARAFSASQQLAQLTEDLAAAHGAQLVAAEAIYEFKLQQIEADRLNANRVIEQSVVTGAMTETEAARAVILNDKIAVEKANLVRLEEEERVRAAASEVRQADLGLEKEKLESQARFLRGREEQLASQLEIITLTYQLEALALEEVIASRTATQAQKDIAAKRLEILSGLESGDKAEAKRNAGSPGEKYLEELETGFANINDEIEQLAVDKVRELAGAFGDAAANAFGLTGILGNLVSKLIEMAFQYAIILPLMRQVFGAGGTGGGGGLMSMLGSIFGGSGGIGGANSYALSGGATFAAGGEFGRGQRMIVGERGPEVVEFPAAGKVIPNHALGPAGGEGGVVKLMVASSPFFHAEVQKVAGAVSVEIVRRAAPEIANMSSAKTRIQMARPKL